MFWHYSVFQSLMRAATQYATSWNPFDFQLNYEKRRTQKKTRARRDAQCSFHNWCTCIDQSPMNCGYRLQSDCTFSVAECSFAVVIYFITIWKRKSTGRIERKRANLRVGKKANVILHSQIMDINQVFELNQLGWCFLYSIADSLAIKCFK